MVVAPSPSGTKKEGIMARALNITTGATGKARQAADSPAGQGLARWGYLMKGLVYLIVGLIAGRVAIGDSAKTTDNKGALQAIYRAPFGQALLAVVLVGLVGYALWCFLRAILDADRKGTSAKGIVARIGYGVVGLIYASLAFSGLHLLLGAGTTGKSTDASAQDWTATLLQHSYGEALVIAGGVIIIAVGLFLFYYAYSKDFMQSFSGLSSTARTWIGRLGRVGYGAQGVVFSEVGIFLIVAAQRHDPHAARGIGGALAQLTHEPYGHVLLALIALGLIAYGLFSFTQARFRRLGAV
jgi:hypothetical protein